MTKRPSAPSMKITYVNAVGERQEIGVREIFCRMDGDALVLTQFENSDGKKVKDLPIAVPVLGDADDDVDDADRLHELALAEFGDEPSPPAEIESEPEAPGRRRLRRGGSRLDRFGNMTRRLIRRLLQRARPWPHRPPLSRRRASQQQRRLSQIRRNRPPARRPVRPCGRSTKMRRPHYVR